VGRSSEWSSFVRPVGPACILPNISNNAVYAQKHYCKAKQLVELELLAKEIQHSVWTLNPTVS